MAGQYVSVFSIESLRLASRSLLTLVKIENLIGPFGFKLQGLVPIPHQFSRIRLHFEPDDLFNVMLLCLQAFAQGLPVLWPHQFNSQIHSVAELGVKLSQL